MFTTTELVLLAGLFVLVIAAALSVSRLVDRSERTLRERNEPTAADTPAPYVAPRTGGRRHRRR
jgi:hypothetical protein